VIEDTFKANIPVHLHSWPKPNYRLGSFIYDVQLPSLTNWKASETELITLSKVFGQLQADQLPIQRLSVNVQDALQLFEDNPFKAAQLKEIAEHDANASINVYRVASHIDFSVGPMIPNTSFVGRVTITAVHPIESSVGRLYRFQGIALPAQLPMHHYPYKMLIDRSRKLNSSPLP
jgi:large subunit ribosomal protein L39